MILQEESFEKFCAFKFTKDIPLNLKIEIVFNFIREILLKISCLQFCMKNPFKIYLTHLQFYKGNPFTFFGKKKSTLKFCLKFTGKSLYKIFLKKNPCKIDSLFRKVVNFTKEIPLNFFRKKINSEIWPQKYPLGSTS